MKFTCEKESLLTAISMTSRTVSTQSNVPSLQGILVTVEKELTLTGYNLETGIVATVPATIEEEGSLVLSARLLLEIIRKMPNQEIRITSQDCKVTITCGQIEFQVNAVPPADYPSLPEDNQNIGFIMPQNLLKSMIGATLFAVSHNDSRPIHTGSLFEINGNSLSIVSVDGYRLALRKETVDQVLGEINFTFVVPGSALSEVEKICNSEETVTVKIGQQYVFFQFADCKLVARRLEGEFIAYQTAIPKDNVVQVFVQRKELLSSVERVSIMISEKLKAPLRCFFGNGILDLSSKTTVGEANDHCTLEGDGSMMEIGLNHRYMQEALRAVPSEKLRIEFSSAVKPCLILPEDLEDERFCYMVLPVRLKGN